MKRLFPLAVVLLLLLPLPLRAKTLDRIAAVVNKDVITTYQLDQALKEQLATLPPGQPKPSGPALDALRRQVLSRLVEDTLIRQREADLGLKASDEEVTAAIQDVQRQNHLTRAQLEEALRRQGVTFAQYREKLRRQILRYKLIGREVQSKVEVTHQELLDYFRAHINDYREMPTVHLAVLSFALPAGADAQQVAAVRTQAAKALVRLRGGASVAQVLKDHRGDQAVRGGDMGTFNAQDLNRAFATAIKGLKAGGVSDLVQMQGSIDILKVLDLTPGEIRKFDTVKDAIRQRLQKEKTETRLKTWEAELKKNAYIDIRL